MEPFEGRIGRYLSESEPWWPTPAHPGPDAPHVVLILLDDLGFSHLSCFGSDLVTPHIDRLAARGLRYTNFHVTPLCSPTRAALLTGRNHHTVGMRGISNWSSGFPSMRGEVSRHAATVAEVLRSGGYATFMVGKWHLVAMENSSAAGPFDQWPLGRGFERFYGFLDGETDQFSPDLVYDNHRIEPPRSAAEGYHLSEDLVDHAIEFIADSRSIRPDRPFFTYLAFGATHAPHQAPPEYLARHRGRYDEGWDVARERWFARQRELGVVAEGTELAPRNPGVEAWADLSDNERRLAARLQEAFAAFLEHTDAQIGRLVDFLERAGELDNTLFLVMSDNGASQEGGPFGVLHEMKFFNGIAETPDEAIARLEEIGGPHSHSNYPWGWAQAGNTPFKWYKQNTHEGGVHVPLVVHWPRRLGDGGTLRRQFAYVTDLAPTILEAAGMVAPERFAGLDQIPLAGHSLSATFDDPEAPTPHPVQYFEMVGHRALVAEGWKAVTRHEAGTPFEQDCWELYHVATDPSECHDLASEEPARLEDLIERWWAEAEAHGVLPLDDRLIELFGARFREGSPHPPSRRYLYRPPLTPVPPQAAAPVGGRSFDLVARLVREGDDGVLAALGDENCGFSLFLEGGHLVFDYNLFGEHVVVTSAEAAPEGACTLGLSFRRAAHDAEVTLTADGRAIGSGHIPKLIRIFSTAPLSIGADRGSGVSERYSAPHPFTGRLDEVEITLVSPGAGDREVAAREGLARQ